MSNIFFYIVIGAWVLFTVVTFFIRRAQKNIRGRVLFQQQVWPKMVKYFFLGIGLLLCGYAVYNFLEYRNGTVTYDFVKQITVFAVTVLCFYYVKISAYSILCTENGIQYSNNFFPWAVIERYQFEERPNKTILHITFQTKAGSYRAIKVKPIYDNEIIKDQVIKNVAKAQRTKISATNRKKKK